MSPVFPPRGWLTYGAELALDLVQPVTVTSISRRASESPSTVVRLRCGIA
jgi:hypothetical protein